MKMGAKNSFFMTLNKFAIQSLPLYSKKFFRTCIYIVIHVPEQLNISAIHEFFSQLSVSLWTRPKMPQIVLVKKLKKVGFSRHPPVLKKKFPDLKLYGD